MKDRDIWYVDVSNLLDRWFFFTDLYNFLNFMRKSIDRPTLEIVCEWNNRYAKTPKQYVFCRKNCHE